MKNVMLVSLLALGLLSVCHAQGGDTELDQLKAQLAEQQKQIEVLRHAL